tara:strand:+ start:76 stop:279 length:204 start_codon:yes stop_codon:yes gene_type:complete
MDQRITNSDIIEKLKDMEQTMVTKKELDAALETVAVLSNEDTMDQVRKSERDTSEGHFKEVDSVEDL